MGTRKAVFSSPIPASYSDARSLKRKRASNGKRLGTTEGANINLEIPDFMAGARYWLPLSMGLVDVWFQPSHNESWGVPPSVNGQWTALGNGVHRDVKGNLGC